jgi:protocatechuate 3,4-dioxygenase beta subunit
MDEQVSGSRRKLVFGALAVGGAFFTTPGLFADELLRTPPQTEGPFYPDRLPLDTDNDLLILNKDLTPAVGEVTHLGGRILDARGEPVRNALVEIWQVDHNGIYIHTQCPNQERRDAHFQGYGRFLTGSTGEYYFRTVKPVPYPGRTPHIHVKVRGKGGKELLTSQCYIKGEAQNERDGIFRAIDPKLRSAVLVDFSPLPKSRTGELSAKWDIVLGVTPEG